MTIQYRKNGTLLTNRVDLIDGVNGFVTAAERGSVGMGGVTIDDPNGDITITGWETFTVDDTNANPTRVWTGFIAERNIGRGPYVAGTGRTHDCTLIDQNSMLHMRVLQFTTNAAKRPEETDVARVQYLLTSEALADLVHNYGLVSTANAGNFLEDDCRRKFADEVLMTLAPSAVKNFFVYYDTTQADAGLFYDRDDAAVWPASISISNAVADIDRAAVAAGTATVYPPSLDASIERQPSDVYSGVSYGWRGDPIYVTSPTTEAAFIRRDAVYDTDRIGRAATALTEAKDWLNVRSGENDFITVTVWLPSSKVNKAYAGQEINVKFTHLPGYSSYTATRIRRRSVKPVGDGWWECKFELWVPTTPVSDSAVPDCASIRQSHNAPTGSDVVPNFDFASATVAGHLLLAWETKRDGACDLGSVPGSPVVWTALSSDVSATGDHGRWWYATAYAGTTYKMPSNSRMTFYETTIDGATFVPADATLYETTGAGPSTGLSLGAVTSPTAGQVILYGCTYDTAFNGTLLATPAAGWTLDYNVNINGATSGTSDQHPHVLTMHWDEVTTPLTGNATISSAMPYCGVMVQVGEACGGTGVPAAGAIIEDDPGTVTPDGSTTLLPATYAYKDGTMEVKVDGIWLLDSDYTETDPRTGDVTLAFAPESDEVVEYRYEAR